jgi:hypothetical protein
MKKCQKEISLGEEKMQRSGEEEMHLVHHREYCRALTHTTIKESKRENKKNYINMLQMKMWEDIWKQASIERMKE